MEGSSRKGRPFVFVEVVSLVPEDPQAARQCQQRVAGFAARTQLFDVTKPHQIGPVTAIAFQSTFSSLPENLYSAVNPTAILTCTPILSQRELEIWHG